MYQLLAKGKGYSQRLRRKTPANRDSLNSRASELLTFPLSPPRPVLVKIDSFSTRAPNRLMRAPCAPCRASRSQARSPYLKPSKASLAAARALRSAHANVVWASGEQAWRGSSPQPTPIHPLRAIASPVCRDCDQGPILLTPKRLTGHPARHSSVVVA